jgi:hypothetical protein
MQARMAVLITAFFLSHAPLAVTLQGADRPYTNIASAIVQPSCPVTISRITPELAPGLSVVVKNLTDSGVVAVQIGWFVVWSNGEISTSLAPASRVQLRPSDGATAKVHPARKPPTSAWEIVPFVASVHFSNGAVWSADILRLKHTVTENFGYRLRPA